jgi:hypothetical protein
LFAFNVLSFVEFRNPSSIITLVGAARLLYSRRIHEPLCLLRIYLHSRAPAIWETIAGSVYPIWPGYIYVWAAFNMSSLVVQAIIDVVFHTRQVCPITAGTMNCPSEIAVSLPVFLFPSFWLEYIEKSQCQTEDSVLVLCGQEFPPNRLKNDEIPVKKRNS